MTDEKTYTLELDRMNLCALEQALINRLQYLQKRIGEVERGRVCRSELGELNLQSEIARTLREHIKSLDA
jgi:hypothetical protein